VVKHVDVAEVRIAIAAVLAEASDAVLVAHRTHELGADLVTARPVEEIALRQELAGDKGRKRGGGDASTAGYEQLGSCATEKMKYTTYVYSAKVILAAMCLRRVGINGRSYAAAPTQTSKVVTPPAPPA